MADAADFRLLLIERNPGIARGLLSSQAGFAIVQADKWPAAEKLAAGGAFDAICIDLAFDDIPALETFHRASALQSGAPVVALAPVGEDAVSDAIMAAGAQACLSGKDLVPEILAREIRQAVLRERAGTRRFRTLFDAAPIGILLAAGRRVAMANPAALAFLGRTEAELASLSILELFPAEAAGILESALDAQPGLIPSMRFPARLGAPGSLLSECRVTVAGSLLNGAPAVALFLESAEERTAIARGRQERQTDKMNALGRLAGGMAHDFNNLLTAINGYSDHLLSQHGSQGALANGLKAIRRAGETAAAMTRNLMDFSRSEGPEARAVRVDEAIREMEPMLRNLLGPRISFRLALGAGGSAVRLEPGQLEKTVLNLCVNARDAMEGGGVLSLSTSVEEAADRAAFTHMAARFQGTHVVLRVEDTGSGMDAEALECLFEPFYTTKRGGRGTGLGLSDVYRIVGQAGGGISVDSDPGKGSRFRIHFALDATAVAPAAAAAPTRPATAAPIAFSAPPARVPARDADISGSGGETVLVVEDEPSLREMLIAILNRYGFNLISAVSADEALDRIKAGTENVDLVVTDVMLRGSDGGHELAASLQTVKPGLRTIFISGHSLETLAERGILLPADAFLEKPFTPSQLGTLVRSILDAARNVS